MKTEIIKSLEPITMNNLELTNKERTAIYASCKERLTTLNEERTMILGLLKKLEIETETSNQSNTEKQNPKILTQQGWVKLQLSNKGTTLTSDLVKAYALDYNTTLDQASDSISQVLYRLRSKGIIKTVPTSKDKRLKRVKLIKP